MKPFPLTKANRILLARAFRDVPRVDLSIECVIENQMGSAFVDDPVHPTAFLIRVGPFHYLAGDPAGPGGQALVAGLDPFGLIMSTGPGWIDALGEAYGEKVKKYPRYRFTSERLSLERLECLWEPSPWKGKVQRIQPPIAAQVWEQPGLADISDFDSPADFHARGIGYCVLEEGRMIGTAYSSLVCSQGIEISLVVEEAYRRQGMATALSCALLRWCLENGMDPHWDAGNPPSKGLALKLGYTFQEEYDLHVITA